LIAVLAAPIRLPVTFGTRQARFGEPGAVLKVAVTERSAVIVSWHVPTPEHAPAHPAKVDPDSALAVSVTEAPSSNECEHVEALVPQSIPAGLLVTTPLPLPVGLTVSVRTAVKVAVTLAAETMLTMHVPVPEQPPPDQPANLDPLAGSPVSLTWVPIANEWEQIEPQSIPSGLDTASPEPLPESVTVRVSGNSCAHEVELSPVAPTVTETGGEAMPFAITRSLDAP
jgi:hypothetical protein